ncbi:MAG: hypothetical protein KDE03_14460 [Rhodobacteraceae bacterium]|nr:hypothetical protein [Paracoccaceae bacterium]
MRQILLFVLMLGAACVAAGLYGAVHNQITFSVGPEYFHRLKFAQFRIPADLNPRIGAALVGWRASWWMGLVAGLPLAALAAFGGGGRRAGRLFGEAMVIVIASAAAGAALSFGLACLAANPGIAREIVAIRGLDDPVGFLRAGAMHDGSYLGAGLGLLIALVRMTLHLRNMNKAGGQ